MLFTLLQDLLSYLHISLPSVDLPQGLSGLLFATILGGGMYILSEKRVETINNILVAGVIASFAAVLTGKTATFDPNRLLQAHWDLLPHGQLISVLFVSCVYHNVVSTITMRLEGDRKKIRRTILVGSFVPVGMFLAYDAAILGAGNSGTHVNELAIAMFSVLAISTSFVGFVEGLTELWSDARQTIARNRGTVEVEKDKWKNFLATLAPPVFFAGLSPDIFLNALDAAGTYGIAILFGGLPAAMAWKNRREKLTKGFGRIVGGGDVVLAGVAILPLLLIGNKIWNVFNGTA